MMIIDFYVLRWVNKGIFVVLVEVKLCELLIFGKRHLITPPSLVNEYESYLPGGVAGPLNLFALHIQNKIGGVIF